MMYQCSKCKGMYERESGKAWIKSYCSNTDSYARLIRRNI